VVDAATATDEARACALNNRADILEKRGDSAGSVADRTAVLNLDDTSYDRRYIAYSRRARSLWRLGEHDAALRDVEALLATADIVMEQKMAALLQRAGWLASAEPGRALADLKAVITSPDGGYPRLDPRRAGTRTGRSPRRASSSGNGCILGQHLGRGPAGHRCGRAFTW
jgi:tetratricopeptide (TPR) repeat protein